MTVDLRDEDILTALDRADEEERAPAILALGDPPATQGPPFLRRLVRDPVPAEIGLSALALTPFAERCGSEATPELLERFTANGRKIDAQRWLLYLIARHADDRAGDAVLDRPTRRLRGEQRGRYGDPDDIPLAITYLAQHPNCAPLLHAAVQPPPREVVQLVKDERRWLSPPLECAGHRLAHDSPAASPTEVEVERMRGWLAQTSSSRAECCRSTSTDPRTAQRLAPVGSGTRAWLSDEIPVPSRHVRFLLVLSDGFRHGFDCNRAG